MTASRSSPVAPGTPYTKEGSMRDPAVNSERSPIWRRVPLPRWVVAAAAVIAAIALWAFLRPGERSGEAARDAQPASAESAGGKESPAAAEVDSVVRLDSMAERLAGIELGTVRSGGAGGLIANGTITYDGNHVSVIASRAEGRVTSVQTDLGKQVRQGDILAIVESPEVGETRGTYGRQQAALEVARRNYEREKSLYEQSISSQKEMLEAEGEYRSAQAELNAALAKLKALGAAPSGDGGSFGLASPVSGTVVERHATPGQIAGPSVDLFTVADLRHVWITVDLYESDLGRVRNGAAAKVIPSALQDSFPGKVTFAGGIVDSVSRTVKVRVEVENESRRLRPGMFAQVHLETSSSAPSDSSVSVPEIAIQEVSGRDVVFVPGSAPSQYVARSVAVGPRTSAGMTSIVRGLRPGDRVVTKGAFQLKAELTKASFAEED